MMKQIVKLFSSTFFLTTLATGLLIYIAYEVNRTYSLYYPDPFFDYQVNHRNISLYSDQPIGSELLEVMDEVSTRMVPLDIYDPGATYHVYVVHSSRLFGSFAQKLNLSTTIQALTINPLGYVLVNLTAIERTGNIYGDQYPHTLYQGDIAYTITHELMHVLTTRELGFFSSWFLPDWKREGYAEYGASLYNRQQDSAYSLPDRTKQYQDGFYSDLSDNQRFYIRSGLISEYLIDVEGMDFNELLKTDIQPDTVFYRLEGWSQSDLP